MAKRDTGAKSTRAASAEAEDAFNERLSAYAEQLGRMAGRMAAKADTLPSQADLGRQLTSVRDEASRLLEQLRERATSAAASARAALPGAGTASKGRKSAKSAAGAKRGRSGGVVDAPGKKHRTPPPTSLGKGAAAGQSARRLTATPRSKAPNRRGRG